jgi:hypothetical protein
LLQRPGGEMGLFASIAGAETALTRVFGRHVFEIPALLRVSQRLHNYRVWVVELIGIELSTPVRTCFNPPGYSASPRYLVITLLVSGGLANILQGGNSSNECGARKDFIALRAEGVQQQNMRPSNLQNSS